MATVTTTKRVTWAIPLIQQPAPKVPHRHGLHHQPTPIFSNRNIHNPSQESRSAADSLRDHIRRAPPAVPRKQPDDRRNGTPKTDSINHSLPQQQKDTNPPSPQQQNDTTTEEVQARAKYSQRSAEERARYEQSRQERSDIEQLILQRDEYLHDASQFFLWAAPCKFTDILEARETELSANDYFSSGEVLVALFINNDLTVLHPEYLAEALVLPLIKFFCNVNSFRFAIFFPRHHVEKKRQFPDYLRYVFGTLTALGRSPNLNGAHTEMEKKFVNKELRSMRRRWQLDHVQIHKDSLEKGYLIAKVDEKDMIEEPMKGNLLLENVQEVEASEPIGIPRPKEDHVDAAWVMNKKGGVWA